MSLPLYSLKATAIQRDTPAQHIATAELEFVQMGRRRHWWLVIKVDNKRAGGAERFPFTSLERPPLEAALREVKIHITRYLDASAQDVHYPEGIGWALTARA